MKKALILVLVAFTLTGFTWGSSKEDDQTNVTATTTSAQRTTTQSSYSAKPVVKKTSVKNTPKAANTSRAATAVASLTDTMGTNNPDELKKRIESLSRVSRALRALNEAKKV